MKGGFNVKEGLLQSELCYKDTGVMDAIPPGNNSRLAAKMACMANRNKLALEVLIHTDLF